MRTFADVRQLLQHLDGLRGDVDLIGDVADAFGEYQIKFAGVALHSKHVGYHLLEFANFLVATQILILAKFLLQKLELADFQSYFTLELAACVRVGLTV